MEEIDDAKFEAALKLAPERINKQPEVTDADFEKLLTDMQNPVNAQKEIAVKVKLFLDDRIKLELEKNGALGDNTRKWIETYTGLLEKLQRAIHGDKSLNLHVHQITHGDIAAKIRESKNHIVIVDKKEIK